MDNLSSRPYKLSYITSRWDHNKDTLVRKVVETSSIIYKSFSRCLPHETISFTSVPRFNRIPPGNDFIYVLWWFQWLKMCLFLHLLVQEFNKRWSWQEKLKSLHDIEHHKKMSYNSSRLPALLIYFINIWHVIIHKFKVGSETFL